LNASVHLLRRVVPSTVHLQANIPGDHPSAGILGAERMGTGVIVGSGGAIVTAHYLLIGAESIQVTWVDGTSVAAQVAGVDYGTGLGVVAVDGVPARGLSVRPVEDVAVGEEVFVVASVGDGRRVGTGFVSSVGPFDAFWEYMIDRAILITGENPGLGGGALLDAHGQLVGIAALSLAEVGKLTFAIPASFAVPMLDGIRDHGHYAPSSQRAWLGVTCYTLRNHIVVAGLIPGGPAATAGLKAGDVVLAIDGATVAERRELFGRLWQRRSGEAITLRVFRGNRTFELEIVSGSVEAFFASPP
jgi:S1-C subfamily serine protease